MLSVNRTREATATALALLILMLTPLLNSAALLAIIVAAVTLYVLVFRKSLTARTLLVGAISFALAAGVAVLLVYLVR